MRLTISWLLITASLILGGTAFATDYCMRFPSGTPVACGLGGGGGVTSVNVTGNNGLTVSSANTTTAASITLGVGAITPSSLSVSGQSTLGAQETWSYDGDQQYMGNTDASKFHIGGYATNSGTLAGLINTAHSSSGDFSHYYFTHNVPTPANGTYASTDDATSTSYIMSFSDNGYWDVFSAPASAGAPSFGATPSFSMNMLTGATTFNSLVKANSLIISGQSTFTGTVNGLTSSSVGLGNVTNNAQVYSASTPLYVTTGNMTIDLTAYAPKDNPTFTGTVNGITASMVGLGNVTNNAQVTSVTASGNLISSGGTTPAISMTTSPTFSTGMTVSGPSTLTTATSGLISITGGFSVSSDTSLAYSSGNVGIGAQIATSKFSVMSVSPATTFLANFGVAGSNSVVIDKNGNVGIGTTTPNRGLYVQNANGIFSSADITATGNTYSGGSTGTITTSTYIRTASSNALSVGANSRNVIKIDNSLYGVSVYPGGTSPTAGAALDIGGFSRTDLPANSQTSKDAGIGGSLEVDNAIYADTAIYDVGIKAITGSVTVCVDTSGKFIKSATACAGN